MRSVTNNLDKIYNKLRETKKRYYLINYSNSVVKTLFLFIVIIALFFALTPFLFQYEIYKDFIIVVLIASLVIVVFQYFLKPVLRLKRNDFFALLMEKVTPGINNLIINSIQLGGLSTETVNKYGLSKGLIDLTIVEASERIGEVSPKKAVSSVPLRKNGIILVVLLIATFGMFFSNPDFFKNTYAKFLYPEMFKEGAELMTVEEVKKERINLPEIGDFRINYKYPAYSGLEESNEEGTSGDIECLKGTQVTIKATSDRPLKGVEFVFNNSQKSSATLDDDMNFTYSLSVIESGVYHLEFKGIDYPDGFEHKLYEVVVKEDAFPSIKLTDPKEDFTVEENEVLKVAFEANDDFGIDKVDLVIERESGTDRVTIFKPDTNVRDRSGRYEYNLSRLDLTPGEVLKVFFEAYDNDTISGPKKSVSNERYFDVYSKEKKLKEISQMKERLFETMIDLLGDHFEKSLVNIDFNRTEELSDNQTYMNSKTYDILALLKEILSALQEEEMGEDFSYIPLDNMRLSIKKLFEKKKGLISDIQSDSFDKTELRDYIKAFKDLKEDEILEAERDILFLDNEKKKEKMKDILNEGEELLNAEKDLIDLLEEMKEGGDMSEAKQKLEEILKKMDETFNKIMEKLAKFPQTLPDEFVNNDSMKDMDIKEDMSMMDKLKDSIKNNNIEEALEQAMSMLNNMNEMMSSFENSAEEYANNETSDMLKDIDDAIAKLDEFQKRQEDLMKDTKDINKSTKEKRGNEQRKDLSEFMRKQQNLVREIKQDVMEIQKELRRNPAPPSSKSNDQAEMPEEQQPMQMGVHGSRFMPLRNPDKAMQKTQNIMNRLNQIPRMLGRDFNQAEKLAEDALKETNELKEGFDKKEFEERMKRPGSMQKTKEKAESAREKEEELLNSFGQFKQNADSFLSKEEREKLKKMAGAQGKLKKDLGKLAKEFSNKTGAKPGLSLSQKPGQKPGEGEGKGKEESKGKGKGKGEGEGKSESQGQGQGQGEGKGKGMGQGQGEGQHPGEGGFGGEQSVFQSLQKAGGSMGQAGQKMGAGQPSIALPHQGDALSELGNAKAGLQEMRNNVMQMQGQKAGGMKPGGMKPGGKSQMSGQPDIGRDDQSGNRGINVGDVNLPGAEDYKVPKEFREDILRGMKEKSPKEYEEKVKGYYEELIK